MKLSLYYIIISEDISERELCEVTLDEADLTRMKDAIEDLYYFEFVIGLDIFCLANN